MQATILYETLKKYKQKVLYNKQIISESEFEESCGLINSRISNSFYEISYLNRAIENLYFLKTKEQLFDLFEMISSDLKDVTNQIENLKSKNKGFTYRFIDFIRIILNKSNGAIKTV